MPKNPNESWLGGADVYFNDIEVGIMQGPVIVRYRTPRAELLAGSPETTQQIVIVEEHYEAEFQSAQLSADIIASIVGNLTKQTISGSPVTVTMGATNSEQTFVAGNPRCPGYESIELIGPNVATLVVKNQAEDTTYNAGAHYLLFQSSPLNSLLVNTGGTGAPASGATVHLGYQTTPVNGEQLDLGAQHTLVPVKLELRGTNRVTGLMERHVMWRAFNREGNLELSYENKSFRVGKGNFKATPDSSHPTNPLGYYFIEKAA